MHRLLRRPITVMQHTRRSGTPPHSHTQQWRAAVFTMIWLRLSLLRSPDGGDEQWLRGSELVDGYYGLNAPTLAHHQPRNSANLQPPTRHPEGMKPVFLTTIDRPAIVS